MLIKNIAIIGSTGSIGTQALEIISSYPDKFNVTSLVAYKNVDLLEEQIRRYRPDSAALIDEDSFTGLNQRFFNSNTRLYCGKEGLLDLIRADEADIVIMALVGIAGLEPTVEAIKKGKIIALANKEVLVTGGALVKNLLEEHDASIIPVDSEHSAIFQSMQGLNNPEEINRLILTASGGPFRGYKGDDFSKVTLKDALKHPNWDMGKKITIDSATMMNKGLEIIEAKWLFDVEADKIDVIVHPESIVHSMVEYIDGSVIAQLGLADMRTPILYALTYPERYKTPLNYLDLAKIANLTFEEPDFESFPCLNLAYDAINIGGSMPVVLNAANEIAVDLFLMERIAYVDIAKIVEKAMANHRVIYSPSLSNILELDEEIRNSLIKDGVK